MVFPTDVDLPSLRPFWVQAKCVISSSLALLPQLCSYSLRSFCADVPKPTVVGLPYEDVTLTTPDNLKIKAYVIPARKHFVSTVELQQMGKEERKKKMDQEIESWAEEMGKEDAVEVSETQSAPDGDNRGPVSRGAQADTAKYARSRPTVIIFHANAGECQVSRRVAHLWGH